MATEEMLEVTGKPLSIPTAPTAAVAKLYPLGNIMSRRFAKNCSLTILLQVPKPPKWRDADFPPPISQHRRAAA